MQHYNTNFDFGKDLHLLLKIFSFFLPVLGFIIYAIKKKQKSKSGKICMRNGYSRIFLWIISSNAFIRIYKPLKHNCKCFIFFSIIKKLTKALNLNNILLKRKIPYF